MSQDTEIYRYSPSGSEFAVEAAMTEDGPAFSFGTLSYGEFFGNGVSITPRQALGVALWLLQTSEHLSARNERTPPILSTDGFTTGSTNESTKGSS